MTKNDVDRRKFLKLVGLGGGVVFASGLGIYPRIAKAAANSAGLLRTQADSDFYFVQLSDTHLGFNNPLVNPNSDKTLQLAVDAVNGLDDQPDFIMFTGDLTDITDDDQERRKRLAAFQAIVKNLKCPMVKFMPGEHDASLDNGAAYKEFFGDTFYTFDYKGIHFVVVDNVSDPTGSIGTAQLAWLKTTLSKFGTNDPIVVFTHRPLFPLNPNWDWWTKDGQQAIDLLMPYTNVSVFYGHIHQNLTVATGHIQHYSARSTMFALPVSGSVPTKKQIPWDPAHPYAGLGYREVTAMPDDASYTNQEFPLQS